MLDGIPTNTWTSAYPFGIGPDELGEICAELQGHLIFGDQGTICRTTNWRIDRQPPPANAVNLQIQRNNVGPPSTMSCVLVPREYQRHNPSRQPDHPDQLRYDRQLAELIRVVRRTLIASAQTHRATGHQTFEIGVYRITGTYSN
jgi:hypothetical protein